MEHGTEPKLRMVTVEGVPAVVALIVSWEIPEGTMLDLDTFHDAQKLVEKAAADLRAQGVVAVAVCPPPWAKVTLQSYAPAPSAEPPAAPILMDGASNGPIRCDHGMRVDGDFCGSCYPPKPSTRTLESR